MIEIMLILVGFLTFNRIKKYGNKPNNIIINDLYTCISSDKQLINGIFYYKLNTDEILGDRNEDSK